MDKNIKSLEKLSNFVIFKTVTGKVNVDVFFQDETLWLTQKKMAELFEKGRSTITEHLKNIFNDGELDEKVVCRDFRHTAEDGKSYNAKYYSLKAITAVGYRVNSHRATEFRKWATEILHEYIIKGFVMDDERLKELELSDYPILLDAGKISALEAKLKAETEYEKYRVIQDGKYISDFDREIKKITGIKDDE